MACGHSWGDCRVPKQGTHNVDEPGHVIENEADYGYGDRYPGRRKVILWSRQPWHSVDCLSNEPMPSGRFASGVTKTPIGDVHVIGVCIPWRDAHVRTGRHDREPWEDHLAYLDGLDVVLRESRDSTSGIVVGDFNQRIPRKYTPRRVADRLTSVFEDWNIVTTGCIPVVSRQAIDHVALRGDIEAVSVEAWDRVDDQGNRLSDHDGYAIAVRQTSRGE
jgi:endonuclease/exonuclease/phosphatase family metal-dependent hydrolase